MRGLAVLDAVNEAQWELRLFSSDADWSNGEQMASMRNGSGDDSSCWFGRPGAAIVGFDHESSMSPHARTPASVWPGLLAGVPDAFRTSALEEAGLLD